MDPKPEAREGGAGWHAAGLAAVFAGELALFCVMAHRHSAWIYPRWSDQLQYLREAYGEYAEARRGGVLHAAWQGLARASAQGSLHGLLALGVFEVLGPSRTAALSVNMLAFIALQAATFLAVRRLSRSFPLAWASVALLAALHFPWLGGPGSALDFRLDWMSACACGGALAAAVATDGFRSRLWTAVFGIAVAAVIMVRYLAAVYFCGIVAVLAVWLAASPDRRSRLRRLFAASFLGFAIPAPALWHSRRAVYDYYWL
jgi:hypothetical protein